MKPGDVELLKQIAEFEKDKDFSQGELSCGWSWRHVRIYPATLNRLVVEGYLDIVFSSNSYTGYRLAEIGKLVIAGEAPLEAAPTSLIQMKIPDDIFTTIEGYEDIKDLVRKVLESEKPVHILFTGVPSSAKTMFLMELARLGFPYILGSQATKAGIADLLFSRQPGILLCDEIDRLGTKDIAILLSLMETGIVSETKYGKRRELRLQTKVFAASNTTNMPRELLSRFLVLHFKAYTQDEFHQVAVNVLKGRENVDGELADYIAVRVWDLAGYNMADPRDAVRVARLARTRDDADRIFDVMSRYSART